MSAQAFTALLVCGAGALALWVIARYTDFGPRSVAGAIVHVVAAIVLLTVLLPPAIDAVDAIGIPASTYVQVFGVALPLLRLRLPERGLGDAGRDRPNAVTAYSTSAVAVGEAELRARPLRGMPARG